MNDDDGLALALDVGGTTIKAEHRRPVPRRPRGGCLEAIASAAAIARRYTGLSGSRVTGAHDVAARLSTGAVARQVWQDAVEALADGLAIVSLLVGPAWW